MFSAAVLLAAVALAALSVKLLVEIELLRESIEELLEPPEYDAPDMIGLLDDWKHREEFRNAAHSASVDDA
jgi:hypothetical protein